MRAAETESPARTRAQRPHHRRPGEHSLTPRGHPPGNPRCPARWAPRARSHLQSAMPCGCVRARTGAIGPRTPGAQRVGSPARPCPPPGRTSGTNEPRKPQRAWPPFPPGPSVAACAPRRPCALAWLLRRLRLRSGPSPLAGGAAGLPQGAPGWGGSPGTAASRRTAARPPCPRLCASKMEGARLTPLFLGTARPKGRADRGRRSRVGGGPWPRRRGRRRGPGARVARVVGAWRLHSLLPGWLRPVGEEDSRVGAGAGARQLGARPLQAGVPASQSWGTQSPPSTW